MTDSQNTPETLSESLNSKVVVADTSSLLMAGTELLTILENCQLVIPAIVVKELEEKRSHATIGFLAREWLRLIEDARVEHGSKLKDGVEIRPDFGVSLRIEPNHSKQESLPIHLQDGSNDSTVLAVANNLKLDPEKTAGFENVVLLSNDVPMRIHSTLNLDIPAYEFNAAQVLDAKPFSGSYEIELTEQEYLDFTKELTNPSGFASKELSDIVYDRLDYDAAIAGLVKLTHNEEKVGANLLYANGDVKFVDHKNKAFGITGKTLEQDVALEFLYKDANAVPIVSIGGSAGTGKTLLTVATALQELKAHNYEKVVVFRSLHEMGQGQEMGFLPGGLDEKMEAWAGAVLDALDVLAKVNKPTKKNASIADLEKQKDQVKRYREMIEIQPITYLRGRSLSGTFIVLDEAQNFSRSELLNIISRVGVGSKIILLWDDAQVDNRYLSAGKNADIWSVINDLKHSDLFAHVTLTKTERSRVAELASSILAKG